MRRANLTRTWAGRAILYRDFCWDETCLGAGFTRECSPRGGREHQLPPEQGAGMAGEEEQAAGGNTPLYGTVFSYHCQSCLTLPCTHHLPIVSRFRLAVTTLHCFHIKQYRIRNTCTWSLLCSALYAEFRCYLVLYMRSALII